MARTGISTAGCWAATGPADWRVLATSLSCGLAGDGERHEGDVDDQQRPSDQRNHNAAAALGGEKRDGDDHEGHHGSTIERDAEINPSAAQAGATVTAAA